MLNKNWGLLILAAFGASLVVACDDEGPSPYDTEQLGEWVQDDGRIVMRSGVENARELNGSKLNGRKLNGRELNGQKLNGAKLNGKKLNGNILNNVRMIGNILAADDGQGGTLLGGDLEDMRLEYEVDNEDETVSSYEESLTEIEVAGDLILATIKQRLLPSGSWINSCENGAKAIQLRGDWDPVSGDRLNDSDDLTTWGCMGTALGDCAGWGYIPGKTVNGASMTSAHQACTRLKMAQYCGDGRSFTQNGTPIDVYDKFGVMAPEMLAWPVEAFWGPDGAICVHHTRKSKYTTSNPPEAGKEYIGCEIPVCADQDSDGDIDFDDYPQALLANRNVQTAWVE